ncbi:MAG TPA: hypothetical protein P5572_09495, partial [Phycisphaerae bacterium]|nr:hypothetical protein [Phycisphaerae bacterium]
APDSVKAVIAAAGGPGIAANWNAHQLERFGQDDVTLFVNTKTILSNPALSGMIVGMMAMSGQQVTPQQLQQWEALAVSLRVEKDGVRLGVYVGLQDGSDVAKLWTSGDAKSGTFLTGLPGERYILAVGMEQDATRAAVSADNMQQEFQKKMQMMGAGADTAKMTELVNTFAGMFRDLRDLSFSVSAAPAGGDGLVGFAKVTTFEKGAAEKCAQIPEILQAIGAVVPSPQVQEALKNVKYMPGAETIAGAKVDHLIIALDQVPGVTPEDYSKVKKVVGSEGLVFRIAALDDQHVVATLGGGTARLGKVIELVQGKSAPLSTDEGIKKAAAMLPNDRYSEGYLAVDTLLNFVKEVGKAIGEDPDIPFTVPQVNAPLGMVMAPVEKTGLQVDVAVPMALLSAAKDVAVSQSAPPAPVENNVPEATPTPE